MEVGRYWRYPPMEAPIWRGISLPSVQCDAPVLPGSQPRANCLVCASDPRTWELAAPTIHPTSSWLLPRSTAIGWLNEEDTMSSRHLWWGPPAPTFWDHWSVHQCAQIWYQRSHNYRGTSCPWEASRESGGVRCPCFFLVTLARENDSSHFSLFSSLPSFNAIFRFQAVGYEVEIGNCISLDSGQKRREVDDNFKFRIMLIKKQHFFFIYFEKNVTKINI